jgi:hypothetical protein
MKRLMAALLVASCAAVLVACGPSSDGPGGTGGTAASTGSGGDAGSGGTSSGGSGGSGGSSAVAPIPRKVGSPLDEGLYVYVMDGNQQWSFDGAGVWGYLASMVWYSGAYSYDQSDGTCTLVPENRLGTQEERYLLTTDAGDYMWYAAKRTAGTVGSSTGSFEGSVTLTMGGDSVTTKNLWEVLPDGSWTEQAQDGDSDPVDMMVGDPGTAATSLYLIDYGGTDYVVYIGDYWTKS